jgi:hypothetical protein
MPEDEITPTSAPTSLFPLEGRCWECIITGKKYLNGKRFTRTIEGSIIKVEQPKTIFEVAMTILDHLNETNDVEHIDRLVFHILTEDESKGVTDEDGDDMVPSH